MEELNNPNWAPNGLMICSRCRLVIGYDVGTSWWLDDETRNPLCTVDEDGTPIAHDPIDNPDVDWHADDPDPDAPIM